MHEGHAWRLEDPSHSGAGSFWPRPRTTDTLTTQKRAKEGRRRALRLLWHPPVVRKAFQRVLCVNIIKDKRKQVTEKKSSS